MNDSIGTLSSLVSELVAAHLEPVLHEHHVGFGSFDLIAATHRAGGQLSQAEIARNLNVSPASLTDSIRLCQRRGLLEQVDDPTDRRKKRIQLTERGNEVLARCLATIDEVESKIEQCIPASDREITIITLKKVVHLLASDSCPTG